VRSDSGSFEDPLAISYLLRSVTTYHRGFEMW